jgi:hypothetical protein
MGCVLVEARHLPRLRRSMIEFAAPGKRLHFHEEVDGKRRESLEFFASMPIRVLVTVVSRTHGTTEFAARDACLAEIVRVLQARSVTRLTIESRQDDRDDQRTIVRARAAEPPLLFDHRDGAREPMLWIADAVTWAVGAGGRWLQRADPILESVVELRPQSAEPGSPTNGLATGSTSHSACRGQHQYAPAADRSQASNAQNPVPLRFR